MASTIPRWLVLLALGAAACGAGVNPGDDDDDGDDDDTGPTPTAVTLTQALAGAFEADPSVYAEIPVRLALAGGAREVAVLVDGVATTAVDDGAGAWHATVAIAGLPDGVHAVVARARGGGAEVTAAAELLIDRDGVQLTRDEVDGHAGTPRVHDAGGHRWLTWTDSRDGKRTLRLVELDGAGRFVGAPRALLTRTDDVLYARTALGGDAVGVLFQEPGGPYENWFAIVGLDGAERVAPIALDPAGGYGSYGGDVVWDGEAFVLVWRVNDGAAHSHVRWQRIAPDGQTTGPIVVAAAGADDPHGGFDPISVIGVAAVGDGSVVAFTRGYWDTALALSLPRCETVAMSKTGAPGAVEYAHPAWVWHHECRLLRDGDATMLVWGESSLATDAAPTELRAARVLAAGTLDPTRGAGAVMVTAPDHRTEPVIAGGVMAWLDERTYVDPAHGRIELWVAPLGGDLAIGAATVFGHARFIEGTAELTAAPQGANRALIWLDERHGHGVTDPKPEVWLDTAWY